ncbi:uncharacterized protein ColSpa_11109 [Colletotrichum spaethianum]|uniref:Uncharacterized protein n=1 Tax=Colletotrichum spaethianum TaxID=700344 RepID=A0AA37USZ8_9PEZI|nr:uncharacterized protein ColSpa_11109 [Colletotrichum spaethianum]GKT50928.1 hypothetical protein ColSpa_11109 [Colletotrichum spaethianum]
MANPKDHELTPTSPVVDKGKGKDSFAESIDATATSLPTGQASQLDDKRPAKDDIDLELLKMQEFFKGEPLAHCLDEYIPPTHIDKEVKILPLEKDGGESMVKAAKIELWNKLASLTDALEERYPSVKEEREAKEAVIAAHLDEAPGESSNQGAKRDTTQTSTKASRRAEKKAQKKADKKAQKATKRENPISNSPPAVTSSKTQQGPRNELSLREKYPDIFSKIDYWRSLPDPDAPAAADDDYVPGTNIESSQLTTQPIVQSTAQPISQPAVQQTQSTSGQDHGNLAARVGNNKTLADDSSESDNWSTGSSDGDPFYLNKYLTPSYQAAAKVFLEDFDRKNPTQPTTLQPVNQSVAKLTVQPAVSEVTDGEESFTFIQRDPKEKGVRASLHVSDEELSDSEEIKKAKAIEAQKGSIDSNKRAHELVNAAHAEGKIIHLENSKPLRDAVKTKIKKEDIVPGFGQKKKKQPALEFDEQAYAARSIASHTMKPAPLRIPSRMKQPTIGRDKNTDVDRTTPNQAESPQLPDALKINTNKYRMVTGEFTALGVDFGKGSNRTASGSSTHSGRSAVNFSWPKAQRAGAKNKYEFNDEDESDYELDKKNSNAHPAQLGAGVRQSDPASAHARTASGTSYAHETHKNFNNFGNKSIQPNTPADDSSQETQRRSFTADEYQRLIQDDYDAFTKASPEKKQKLLEEAVSILNNGSTMRSTGATSNITHQTIVVPAHQKRPTVRLPGTTALPPTPATSQILMTTGEKMAELDDFFSEENDHLYTTTCTDSGSKCGNGAETGIQGQVQDQPWNDSSYHEGALSYGYAYKQTNYTTLADSMNLIPLTDDQRRQLLESYGMSEAEYPAPPNGYPSPPGPVDGSNVPPCPTRPAPVVPTTASAESGGNEPGNGGGQSSADGGALTKSLRKHRRFQRAATAPPAPEPGYDADWF